MYNEHPRFVRIIHGIIRPTYNVHPYFPLKTLGKKLHINRAKYGTYLTLVNLGLMKTIFQHTGRAHALFWKERWLSSPILFDKNFEK